jgi:low temperature requirement protein LtrA
MKSTLGILFMSAFRKSTHKQNVKSAFQKILFDILFMSAFQNCSNKQNVKSAFQEIFFDILFMSAFQKSLANRMSRVLKIAGKWL